MTRPDEPCLPRSILPPRRQARPGSEGPLAVVALTILNTVIIQTPRLRRHGCLFVVRGPHDAQAGGGVRHSPGRLLAERTVRASRLGMGDPGWFLKTVTTPPPITVTPPPIIASGIWWIEKAVSEAHESRRSLRGWGCW